MHIAFIRPEELQQPRIRRVFPRATLAADWDALKNKTTIELLVLFLDTPISVAELNQLPALRYIVTQSTGFDHIDIAACKKRGIQVYNTPDYGTETVAEYTLLLILALLRKFKQSQAAIRSTTPVDTHALHGRDAHAKILGVIGTGRIGREVIKRARAFGMRVLACDSRRDPELIARYATTYVDLNTLLRRSDILTLHIPLLPSTKHILNSRTLSKTKKGIYIVNTARGGLIDSVALARALDRGQVAGAALDVIEAEALLSQEADIMYRRIPVSMLRQASVGNLLLQRENVILTPHIAYNTEEALQRIAEKTIATIQAIAAGKTDLSNRVA